MRKVVVMVPVSAPVKSITKLRELLSAEMQLYYLLPYGVVDLGTDSWIATLEENIKRLYADTPDAEKYMLLVGHRLVCAMATVIALKYSHKLWLLAWDGAKGEYVAREVSMR